jgi:hypothetical protein
LRRIRIFKRTFRALSHGAITFFQLSRGIERPNYGVTTCVEIAFNAGLFCTCAFCSALELSRYSGKTGAHPSITEPSGIDD